MLYQRFKTILTAWVFILLVAYLNISFALDCSSVDAAIAAGQDPGVLGIVCPAARVFNFFLMAVGVALVVMIGYGTIKIALSQGDPKGLAGSRLTWTHAVQGALVVLFSIAVYIVIANLFGIKAGSPDSLLCRMSKAMDPLVTAAGIHSSNLPGVSCTP